MVKHVSTVRRFLFENSLFLIIGSVSALIWANTSYPSYAHFVHSVHFWVNDVGMAFFFGLAAKEITEAVLPGGSLSSRKTAALPLLATLGGMVGPAFLYILGCVTLQEMQLIDGWAIPCATDIAFSYLVARFIFGVRHPAIPFLLLLAIADDALGLIILATAYPTGETHVLLFGMLVGLGMAVAWTLRNRAVRSFWPYLICGGGLSWFGFHYGGIHPALALVPIIPFMPHAPKDIGLYDDREERRPNTLDRFEHWWKNPVEIILMLFGLVNAGVIVQNAGIATGLIFLGLLLGKPLGIASFTWIGTRCGLRLPRGMSMRHVTTLGFTAGIGFTVALFISTVAFPAGPILESAKMGALASFAVALIAIAVAKTLHIQAIR